MILIQFSWLTKIFKKLVVFKMLLKYFLENKYSGYFK